MLFFTLVYDQVLALPLASLGYTIFEVAFEHECCSRLLLLNQVVSPNTVSTIAGHELLSKPYAVKVVVALLQLLHLCIQVGSNSQLLKHADGEQVKCSKRTGGKP